MHAIYGWEECLVNSVWYVGMKNKVQVPRTHIRSLALRHAAVTSNVKGGDRQIL